MDIGNSREIWLGFIQAKYLKDAMTYEGKCPTCRSPKDCNNYFCVHCKVGGLCPVVFRAGGEHHRHRWLQVRRQSRMCAVDPNELAVFVGTESTKHIQSCSLNGGTLCYLTRTKTEEVNGSPIGRSYAPGSSSSRRATSQPVNKLMACSGCNRWITNSVDCKEEFLVCCLQCLMTVAQREQHRNLLQLKDGALDLTDLFPQTALEKTGCSAKPGDHAPGQAAGAGDDEPVAAAAVEVVQVMNLKYFSSQRLNLQWLEGIGLHVVLHDIQHGRSQQNHQLLGFERETCSGDRPMIPSSQAGVEVPEVGRHLLLQGAGSRLQSCQHYHEGIDVRRCLT